EGTGKPEYGKCVEISTAAALREMMLPGVITIVTPIIIGFVMGPEALGAYMAGVTVSGVLWAIFQNNAGGAWDNAKKSFEKGVEIEVNGKKEIFYKKSEPHKAAVVGDTVGDPFKDTSGPSMNILIKLSCLVGLTLAPILGNHEDQSNAKQAEVKTEAKKELTMDDFMNAKWNTKSVEIIVNPETSLSNVKMTVLSIDDKGVETTREFMEVRELTSEEKRRYLTTTVAPIGELKNITPKGK
ncbi:MAG: sodium/proton-translocating pyrophosphatase, partial [Flavobacteriales bacterium]